MDPGRNFHNNPVRKWFKFVKNPQRGNMAVVRELYSNASTKSKRKSWVRGVEISYSTEIINAHFKLPGYPKFVLDALLEQNVDAKVLEGLFIHEAEWSREANKYLFVKSMPKEVKA